jgi:hypothetical protein
MNTDGDGARALARFGARVPWLFANGNGLKAARRYILSSSVQLGLKSCDHGR